MAIRMRARRKRGNKKRGLAKGSSDITITPAQRKSVLSTLAALQKDAKDIALKIEDVQNTLCEVDFCGTG
jgi:hypothetical protein